MLLEALIFSPYSFSKSIHNSQRIKLIQQRNAGFFLTLFILSEVSTLISFRLSPRGLSNSSTFKAISKLE